MTVGFRPIQFDVPLVNPAPLGLYSVTAWSDSAEGEPLRWLPTGVQIRPVNYGGGEAFGVWAAAWDAAEADLTEDDVKLGVRPEIPPPFSGWTIWAEDHCDRTDFSAEAQSEMKVRVAQNMRLMEQPSIERLFAERMLADVPSPTAVGSIVEAVGALEDAASETNTLLFFHARPGLLAAASQAQLVVRTGAGLKTPGGHSWVFGGGYVQGLADTVVATSPTFGWRSPVVTTTSEKPETTQYMVIAERSVLVGYEAAVAAVTIG